MKSVESLALKHLPTSFATGDMPVRHFYLHVPFCPKVCPYCSFYKQAGDHGQAQPYLDAVVKDLESTLQCIDLQPTTVFIGGGTPTALRTTQLEFLLKAMSSLADFSRVEEWTIEMNPATVTLEKAQKLRELGVNRVSMGVQSWDPQLLEVLGRVHSAQQAEESYEILREAGFKMINLDHIFAIPGQTSQQWKDTLEYSISLRPEHISAYCLTYEEDTEFIRRYQSGEFQSNDERDASYFELANELLEQSGYRQYETSNYSLPGYECQHNLAYWNGADYLGLGPSAFSTVGNSRWQLVADTARYVAAVEAGQRAISFSEEVSPEIRVKERIAFGIRTRFGVPLALLDSRKQQVEHLRELKLVTLDGGNLIVAPAGRVLVDAIAESLL